MDADTASSMLNSVPDTDIAQGLINALLNTDVQSPLMTALSVFSVNMLAIATLMLAWHTVVGIVSSAQTGKFLGGKWHTIWAPVRISIGVAMLLPIINGATAGQLIVKQVATWSNSMASNVWQAYATTLLDTPVSVPNIEDVGGYQLAIFALKRDYCVAAVNSSAADMSGASTISDSVSASGERLVQWPAGATMISAPGMDSGIATGGAPTRKAYVSSATFDFGVACGKIIVPTLAMASNDTGAAAWQGAQVQNVANLLSDIAGAHIGYDFVQSQMPNSTTTAPTPDDIKSTIMTIAASFDAAQKEAAQAYVKEKFSSASGDLKESLKAEGWVSAGVYWRTLTEYSKTYMQTVTTGATGQMGSSAVLGGDINEEYDRLSKGFNFVVDRVFPDPSTPDIHAVASNMSAANFRANDVAEGGDGSTVWNAFSSKVTALAYGVTSSFSEQVLASSSDPIGDMINLGHGLIALATGLFMMLGVLAIGFKNIISSSVGLGSVFDIAAMIGETLGMFFGGVGVLYAYILPMMPFYFIIMLLVGWVTMIVEAIIAVIIWAFLFVRMDGDEMVDNPQRQGVLIIFNLLLRPTLGVLALCLSMTVLPLLLRVVNRLVVPAFFSSQGSSMVAVVGVAAGVGIAAFIHYQIIVRTLSLITDLPDRVARWFGLPGEGLGESGHVHHAAGAFAGAALGSARHMSGATKSVVGRMGNRTEGGGPDGPDAPSGSASDPSAPRSK